MRFIHKNPLHYLYREDGQTVLDGRRFMELGPMVLNFLYMSHSWATGSRYCERFAVMRNGATRWPLPDGGFIPMRRSVDPGFSEMGGNGGGWRTFPHSQWKPGAERRVENEYSAYLGAIERLLEPRKKRLLSLMRKLLKEPVRGSPVHKQALNLQKEIDRLNRWRRAKRRIYIGKTGDYKMERI